MIHGGGDTYIKPEMARPCSNVPRSPKEFWLVEGAKHNQALQVAGTEYHRRVLDFFVKHLAAGQDAETCCCRPKSGLNGTSKTTVEARELAT